MTDAPPSPLADGCAYRTQSPPLRAHGRDWRGFLRLNAVQRCLSAAVLAPLVTYFLWVSPAFGTTTVCSFVTSTCSYEYAWLANRIRLRLLTRLRALDGELFADGADDADGVDVAASETASPHQTRSSSADESAGGSASTGGSNLRGRASVDLELRPTTAGGDDRQTRAEEEERYLASVDIELRAQEQLLRRCAVSGVAARWFSGREWVAAGAVALPVCAASSALLLTLAEYVPQLDRTEFYESRWLYAVATSYVSALCACLAPDGAYAVIVFAQNAVFSALTMHSTICPINSFRCGQSASPASFFAGFVVLLALFRFATSRHRVTALLNLMLDALGFVYIIGSLSVLVAFVDDDKRSLYRKLLIALLYVVWASDSGAYATGKLLARLRYPKYNPLAAHLSKNKDYEGTLGAIAFGMAAMVAASDLLDVPGATGTKLLFTVLAVVVGRLGDLFESLLKRAAGVKDSGSLIPGHGGVLDRIDALMFATLVFARYYALVM